MPALRELQNAFTSALFDASDMRVLEHIRPDGLETHERLDLYRYNVREGFIKALALSFPVMQQLVGEDYFRQLALDFMHAHPSRSGNLHHIGAPFAPFLRERFANTQYAYFEDVAALEWAYQEALVAAEATPLTTDAFRNMDPSEYESLIFELHPACSFVKANCPVVQIWRANQPGTESDEVIDLASEADHVLVLRTPECIEMRCLPAAQFGFFSALRSSETLGKALEQAQALDQSFDVGAALRYLFELNLLTGLKQV